MIVDPFDTANPSCAGLVRVQPPLRTRDYQEPTVRESIGAEERVSNRGIEPHIGWRLLSADADTESERGYADKNSCAGAKPVHHRRITAKNMSPPEALDSWRGPHEPIILRAAAEGLNRVVPPVR